MSRWGLVVPVWALGLVSRPGVEVHHVVMGSDEGVVHHLQGGVHHRDSGQLQPLGGVTLKQDHASN